MSTWNRFFFAHHFELHLFFAQVNFSHNICCPAIQPRCERCIQAVDPLLGRAWYGVPCKQITTNLYSGVYIYFFVNSVKMPKQEWNWRCACGRLTLYEYMNLIISIKMGDYFHDWHSCLFVFHIRDLYSGMSDMIFFTNIMYSILCKMLVKSHVWNKTSGTLEWTNICRLIIVKFASCYNFDEKIEESINFSTNYYRDNSITINLDFKKYWLSFVLIHLCTLND